MMFHVEHSQQGYLSPTNRDVIVVGGGHAGCEAAAAACRLGAQVALVTMSPDQIGAMSCNPAIGGLGKGILVREVDAWDGLIGRAADASAIHHRMLNRSKGPAVWGPRVQADRRLFKAEIQRRLRDEAGLTIVRGEVVELAMRGGWIAGVILDDGSCLSANAVVIASGTFLGGVLHCGGQRRIGGRTGEPAAHRLAQQFRDLALPLARLKTGTPPRLKGRTIDWSRLDRQPSDIDPWTMSPMTARRVLPQLACSIARTSAATHDIIRESMTLSPLRSGAISGRGPRYCPSIEDKVERFADRDGHQIFLEPEGLADDLIYPNGISTSLPVEVQQTFVNTIEGLERTRIVEPGYAVEYDHVDPRSLGHDLGVRDLPGLFLAGQINGTTGYEEAAAQGLVAGLNAARHADDREPILFSRSESYIGVLVDDLVLQGVSEPYRMLTGRAEHRLRLRADNSGTRLTGRAVAEGAVGRDRAEDHDRRTELRERLRAGADLPPGPLAAELQAEMAADSLYEPYVARQDRELSKLAHESALVLPSSLRFEAIAGLSGEMIERLSAARPTTLGAAARVAGVTPAAVSAIMIEARRAA